jgi:hypothetical protein
MGSHHAERGDLARPYRPGGRNGVLGPHQLTEEVVEFDGYLDAPSGVSSPVFDERVHDEIGSGTIDAVLNETDRVGRSGHLPCRLGLGGERCGENAEAKREEQDGSLRSHDGYLRPDQGIG